jgi:hypothetical protein
MLLRILTTYCKIKWDAIGIFNDLQNGDGLHHIHTYSVKRIIRVHAKCGDVQMKQTASNTNC